MVLPTQTSISATEKRLAESEIVEITPMDSSRAITRGRLTCSRCGQISPKGFNWRQAVDWYSNHAPCTTTQQSLFLKEGKIAKEKEEAGSKESQPKTTQKSNKREGGQTPR